MAAADGGAHLALQAHLEDMRKLTECKICLKPFYEPYILSCGHTYCYSCLRSWFGTPADRKSKNCPDCRTTAKVQPAPNYVLREMTRMFIGRIELLPEDESVEQHNKDKQAEAAALKADQNGPGLFQGLFKDKIHPHFPHLPLPHPATVIRDIEDGVDRCPICTWEIEDGMCPGCGLQIDDSYDPDELDYTDDDSDDDSNSSLSVSVSEGLNVRVAPAPRFYGLDEDSDEEGFAVSVDLDHYDPHDGFVDDVEEVDVDDMDGIDNYEGYPSEPATPYSNGTEYTVNGSDNDGAVDEEPWVPHRSRPDLLERHRVVFDSDDEGEEVGAPAQTVDWQNPPQPRNIDQSAGNDAPSFVSAVRPNRRRLVVISDDEDEEVDVGRDVPTMVNQFHAPAGIEDEDENDEDEEDDDEEEVEEATTDEEDDSESDSNSGEDDSDSNSDSDSGSNSSSDPDLHSNAQSQPEQEPEPGPKLEAPAHNTSDQAESEDTDGTAVPPQSGRDRRQRLQSHRARRPQKNDRITIDLITPPTTRRYDRSSNNLARAGRRSRATPVH